MRPSRSFVSFVLFSLLLLGADPALSQKLQGSSNGHPFASKLLRHQPVNQSSYQLQNFEKELRTIPFKVAEFKAQTVTLSKNQTSGSSVQSATGVLTSTGAPMHVVFDRDYPTPIFIEAPHLQNPSTMSLKKLSNEAAAQAGMDFLIANAGLLRIENPAQEFELIDTDREDAGMTHLRYQQKYQGLEVWGQDIRVHLNADGSFESFNGRYISTPNSLANYKTVVDEQTAVQIAQQQLGTGASEVTSRKLIYVDGDGKAHVAWFVQLRRGLGENWYHFIDVETGVTLKRYNNVMTDGPVTGTGTDLLNQTRTLNLYQLGSYFYMIDLSKPMFNATQSTLPQNGKGVIYTYDAKTTDSLYYFVTSTSPNSWPDKATVSASANGALVYDYYSQVHGRNAIDNNGSTIYMAVHYQKNLNNAFWNGRMMVFGDGDGLMFSNLAAGLDVTAHEMTHGVVASTANLIYENQSGALNESFADVFGEMCEYWAKGNCDWLIGEDVTTPGVPGDALRDMADPSSSKVAFNNQQPTNMSEYRTLPDTPAGDNGGVHTNSGITNRAFYLFATSPVVGNNNAAKVYYRALTKYLTRSAQFTDCRIAVIKSAEDLFGGPGNAVAIIAGQAFDAVGISSGNSTQAPTPLPSVQGQPYLAIVGSQAGLLYRSSPDGQNIQQISAISPLGRPAPTDNGSYIFFIDRTNNLHIVSSDGSNHTQLSFTGGYNAVAISPNGRYLAATLSYQVPRLYVLDLLDTTNAGWKVFQLYIPIYVQGATGGTVRFPDRIDWALNNQVVMYDVYSTFVNATGNTSGFWDINLLRITDSSISRLIPPPPLGVEIGDPVFASNTDNVVAFDYIDASGQVTVRATNLFSGAIGIVTNNYSSLGNPSFSSDDKKIFYQYKPLLSDTSVYVVDLQQDGLTGAGDDKSILVHAEYPVAFTVGTRVTNVAPIAPKLASPSNGATGLPTNPLLIWNSSSTANYYTLQVSTSQSFSSLVVYQTGLVDTSFRVSGLSNNAVYYWRVSASNTVGSSPYSSVASLTTIVSSPQSPTSVTPIDGAKNISINPMLSWTKIVGASSYHLQVALDLAFSATVVSDSTITDTVRVIGPLQNNTMYYWRVRAKNVAGTSSWSSVRSFTTIIAGSAVQELAYDDGVPENYLSWTTPDTAVVWFGAVPGAVLDSIRVAFRRDGSIGFGIWKYTGVSRPSPLGKNYGVTTLNVTGSPTFSVPYPVPYPNWRKIDVSSWNVDLSSGFAVGFVFGTDPSAPGLMESTEPYTQPHHSYTYASSASVYNWYVFVSNNAADSAYKYLVRAYVHTGVTTIPSIPVLSSPPHQSTGVSTLPTLMWNASSGVNSYRLQVSTLSSFITTVVDDSTLVGTSRQIGPLSNNTLYYWRVSASNAGGTSQYSSPWSFTTIAAAPGVPTLASPSNGATNVSIAPTLTWNAVTGATYYHIQVSTSTNFTATMVDKDSITATSFKVTGLLNATVYYWRVLSWSVGGPSAYSTPFTFATIVASPGVPSLVSPSNGVTGVPLALTLTWTASSGATTYRLQIAADSNFVTTVLNDSTLTTTQRQVGPLSNGVKYFWRVNATNVGGTSQYSTVWNFMTIIAAPTPPTLLLPVDSAINVSLNPTLGWNPSAGATSYELQVSPFSNFMTYVFDDTTAGTSQAIGPLNLASTYCWRVRAKNAGGFSAFSSARTFKTILASAVEQLDGTIPTEYALRQNYPNPFNPATTIQFALPKSSYVTLKVFDALGKEVTTLVSQELGPGYFRIRWNASNVPSGIYFYRLQAGEYVETKKAILLK